MIYDWELFDHVERTDSRSPFRCEVIHRKGHIKPCRGFSTEFDGQKLAFLAVSTVEALNFARNVHDMFVLNAICHSR